ncbi:MAG TPA: hypothetical protein VFU23_03075, partial [Gemmatimonadales bacterium]|nr:hypothetical protein [Gemmatimonadales bacterium]
PVFERFGVLHCKTDAFTSAVHNTAVQALSPLIAPYLVDMANSIYEPRVSDPTSAAGMIFDGGRAVHPEIQRHLELYSSMAGEEAGRS